MRFVSVSGLGLISWLLIAGCCEVGDQLSVFTLSGRRTGWQCVPGGPTDPGPSQSTSDLTDPEPTQSTSDATDPEPPQPTFIDLGVLPGAEWSAATRVNIRGTVVGHSYSGVTGRPYRWTRDTGMVELPTFGGEATVTDLNDLDEIVGYAYIPRYNQTHAVLWDAEGNIEDLGTLGEPELDSRARGINNNGEVVGLTPLSGGGHPVGFIWSRPEGMRRLDIGIYPEENGFLFTINDINDYGVVVGRTFVGKVEPQAPYQWSPEEGLRHLAGYNGLASPPRNRCAGGYPLAFHGHTRALTHRGIGVQRHRHQQPGSHRWQLSQGRENRARIFVDSSRRGVRGTCG
jgi:hypothetical protein